VRLREGVAAVRIMESCLRSGMRRERKSEMRERVDVQRGMRMRMGSAIMSFLSLLMHRCIEVKLQLQVSHRTRMSAELVQSMLWRHLER